MRRLWHSFALVIALFLLSGTSFADNYPKFDISGFKKWQFQKIQVSPSTNYFTAQSQLGGFTNSLSTSPWQERLYLKINSQINERLSVNYDIEQEPETPQKSNVKVDYENFELLFGEFQAAFTDNEFASTTKYLNGAMLSYDDGSNAFRIVPSVKLKSENQALTYGSGNNTRGPYSLGRGSILEGTEKIFVNDVLMTRGVDYTIDYFEGKVTFAVILSPLDRIAYTYEYTNLIDMFFPSVSRREFFGFNAQTKMKRMFYESDNPDQTIPVTFEAQEDIPVNAAQPSPAGASLVGPSNVIRVYDLKNKPVVEFSESVRLNGELLRPLEDYSMDYNSGKLNLAREGSDPSTDRLNITYNFFDTKRESEVLSGTDSRGPYQLKHGYIAKGSESIYVNGKAFFRELDYTIDYKEGKIVFSQKVTSSSSISVTYNYIKTITVKGTDTGRFFGAGATYLKETAKKGSASASTTVVETRKGSDLTSGLLNLRYRPLDSTQPVTVTVNGTPFAYYYVPTSDAGTLPLPFINDRSDASDGYSTGTIKFTRALLATDEVSVVYTYKKSIYGKYSGSGNGSQGPYYLTNVNGIVPGSDQQLQVRSDGSSIIETYTRNSSKESSDGQYSVNYNYPLTPYIMFNDPFPAGKQFELIYNYVPAGGTVQDQDLNHDVTGFNTTVKLDKDTYLEGAFAMSRTDQVTISETASDEIKGNNTRGPFSLSKRNISQNSETIAVNGYRMNKDIDYLINYTSGQITFYYLTIKPEDTITATYNYQTSTGGTPGAALQQGYAYKVRTGGKVGDLTFIAGVKEIDPKFSPMGSTNIGSGSQQKDLSLQYSPSANFKLNSSLLETKSQIGTHEGFYLWSTDRKADINYTHPLAGLGINFRNYKTFDDAVPGRQHSADSISDSYGFRVSPVPVAWNELTLTNTNDLTKTETRNNLDQSSTSVDFFHTNNTLNIMKRANLGIEYQQSEPRSQSSTEVTSHEISKDNTLSFDWDLTFKPFSKLNARAKVVNHEQRNLLTAESNATKNETFSLVFDPVPNVFTTYDKNRMETQSVLVGRENPQNENQSYTIKLIPLPNLSIGYKKGEDRSLQETGARSNGLSSNTTLDLTPLPFIKLGTRLQTQARTSVAVSGTAETTTDLDTITRNYNATLTPFSNLSLTGEYIIEDYANRNDSGTVNTKAQNETKRVSSTITPLPSLSSTIGYSQKVTKDLVAALEVPKENIDAVTKLNVFGWGTLTHSWAQERNNGEIQGGVVTSINYLKITNEYSFSITMPQQSVIMSSIVFSAGYKEILYSDLIDPAKSFVASSLNFEGTLNF